MATYKNGLNGPVTGKSGNRVYYQINGVGIVREIGINNAPASDKQLASRQITKIVSPFLNPLTEIIKIGYKLEALIVDKSWYNAASSYHRKNAIKGVYPNQSIDFSKVMFSKGNLQKAKNPTVKRLAEGIEFNWDITGNMPSEIKNDRAMLVLYFPATTEAICIPSGEYRYTGTNFIPLDADKINEPVEAYISFQSGTGNAIADSVYIGRLD